MNKYHNTWKEEIDYSVKYNQVEDRKPNGIWYSINYDWLFWCKTNSPSWIYHNTFKFEIDYSRMCVINTKEELLEFHEKYYTDGYIVSHIDWKKVSEDYSGFEFNNYSKIKSSLDMDYMWIWGWDVSSGCIWDLSIIKDKKYSTPTRFMEVHSVK